MIILYSISMCLLKGIGFLVSHRGLHKPRHFYGLSLLRTMSDHNWRVFHPRGDLSLLADTRHIFSFSCNRATLLDVVPFIELTQSNTKHNVDLPTMHSHTHEMRCFPCICNAKCHCMLSHVTCIMNTTWNNL